MPISTPTPTPTPTPLFNLAFLNTLGAPLTVVLGIITLIGALYGFVSVIVDLAGWVRPPRLDLYMSDVVWLVAEPNPSEFAINVQFVIYNPGRRMAVLRRLEADLIRPSWRADHPTKAFTLEWSVFIKDNPSGHESGGPVFVKAVPSHELDVLGVQLRGHYDKKDSSRAAYFDWFPGQYILHLYGLVNDRRVELSPRSGFMFELNETDAQDLSPTRPFAEPFSNSARLGGLSGNHR